MKRLRSEGGRRRVVYKKMWESLYEEVSFAPKLHVEKEPAGGVRGMEGASTPGEEQSMQTSPEAGRSRASTHRHRSPAPEA